MSRRAAPDSRSTRILGWLDNAPAGLTSTALCDLLGETVPRQRAQTWINNELWRHEQAGHVRRAGRVPSPHKRGKPYLWTITPAGRAWLAEALAAPQRAAARASMTRAQAGLAKAARDAALAAASDMYGAGTPRPERRKVAAALRATGATLDQIAAIFCVSREMIRMDLVRRDFAAVLGDDGRLVLQIAGKTFRLDDIETAAVDAALKGSQQ